jgi:hypothetical protein
MMEASIEKTGDASVKSIQDAIKQIEKIKISSSDPEKANEILGLDAVKNRLGDNLKPETIGGRVFKKLTNVDLRTEKASQAFSAEKLFGLAPSKETQIERLEQTAREEAEVKAKGDAGSTAVNALTQESESTETVSSSEAKGSQTSESTETVSSSEAKGSQTSESTETIKPTVTKNAEGGEAFKTGIDRESSDNKQVELLEAILAQLKDMGEMNSDGDDGLDLPPGPRRRNRRRGPRNRRRGPGNRRGLNRSSTVKPNVKPKTSMLSRAGKLGRGLGRFARFAGPVGLAVSAGMAVADGVSGFTADENATTGQSFQNAGRNIMSGLTFGLVDSTQEKMEDGSYQQDRILEAAEDAGFYDKDYMGKSEIDKTKIQDASIPQLQAILADDDLRPQDVKFVEDLIVKKQQTSASQLQEERSVTPSVSTGKNDGSDSERPAGEMSVMDGYVPNPTSLPDVSPIPPPTGDAVNNMTEATAAQSAQSAPTVINNITNNNTSGSQSSPVMVAPTTPRNATNSFIDFQKQQYTRI